MSQEQIQKLVQHLGWVKLRPIMYFGHKLTYDVLTTHLFGIYMGFSLMGYSEGVNMFESELELLPDGTWPAGGYEYLRGKGFSEEECFYRLLDLHIQYWESRLELEKQS